MLAFILALFAFQVCDPVETTVAIATQNEDAFIAFAIERDIEDFDLIVDQYENSLPITYTGRSLRDRISDWRNGRSDEENELIDNDAKEKRKGLIERIQDGRKARSELQRAKGLKWIGFASAIIAIVFLASFIKKAIG